MAYNPLINMENGREDYCLRNKHGHIYIDKERTEDVKKNIVVCNKRKEREKRSSKHKIRYRKIESPRAKKKKEIECGLREDQLCET